MSNIFKCEVNTPRNNNLFFPPINGNVRGRWEFSRMPERETGELVRLYGPAIPGQHIHLNAEAATAQIIEPIYGMPELLKHVERRCFKLPPEVTTFEKINVLEWQFWLINAKNGGNITVMEGTLPESVDWKPKLWGAPEKTRMDLVFETLAAFMLKQLSDKERKEFASMLNSAS